MFKLLHDEKRYLQELTNMITEQKVKIPVEHPGMLEVPEGKDVESMGLEHFKALVKKKSFPKISRALINLKVWNRERDTKLSSWALRLSI